MDAPTNSIHTGVLERMQRRQEEREERLRQRQLEREEQTGLSTSAIADHFLKAFQGMRTELKAEVEAAESVAADELTQYLDGLVKGVQELQDMLNDSSRHLASFQQKKAQEEVDEASAHVQAAVANLQPTKKFGFGRKKMAAKGAIPTKKPVNQDSTAEPKKTALDELADQQFFGFRNETGRTLTVDPEELIGRQLNLHNLVDCTIIALGSPSAIQAASLDRCTVLVGPAARSAFIKDCHHCTFVLAGQQMRVHNTLDSDLYIHVTSAAIIEGCQRVRVAPYNLAYPDLDQHYLTSGLNTNINHWDKLDDFDWLNENEASPNWSTVPEGERRCNWLA
ncbi:tubulin-specific chaperone C-like [Portunus trituberculatus]|uniref:tubulin-specific chaperone C-like n=1 Tax=Portunus trituberculatus TaxID=210409 RepID=UPI001E1D165B|nr:tubulin-specific chaperone C-like [Portunus trituberculatus]XP_045123935.1 tubulin-specific chaperone C-like [Portunus trituberculatus]XP_045123936.1 tubulin-specific chaperone C-like [Portunus trituberculatus]XP_045123937.1 tubulin-specific chaperone C-like [Portunus trituberculatus]XP_045123938.1 tubulin-specific chaperone C-like [Portunus trituberculatus]XP_045123939.1 tubulin-specific chaperone C-like [Portunus trituberculatus]XP_045123940.1 tubulin-specific chaperone C-like [Portunus 